MWDLTWDEHNQLGSTVVHDNVFFQDLDSERSSVYSVYRKNSVGALSSIKTTKSSPIASVTRSENPDNQLGHDDIISLTHDVRSFSEALAKLKTVFERTRLEPSGECRSFSMGLFQKVCNWCC